MGCGSSLAVHRIGPSLALVCLALMTDMLIKFTLWDRYRGLVRPS